MFEDFFSSTRGPGVVGMLLAGLVLAAFVGFGVLVLDDRFTGGEMSLDAKVAEQADQIAHLEGHAGKLEGKLEAAKEAAEIRSEVEVLTQRVAKVGEAAQEQEASLAGVQERLEDVREKHREYRQNYRDVVRAQAVGTKIEALRTEDGKVYENVVIRAVDSLGLSFITESGPKKVPYTELPAEMQDYYQFGEEEAEAQRAKLREDEDAAAARIAQSQRNRRDRKVDYDQKMALAERQKLENKIAELERGIQSAQRRVEAENLKAAEYRSLHAQAMARGNISGHLAKAQKAEEAAARWRKAIDAAERQIAELQQMLR